MLTTQNDVEVHNKAEFTVSWVSNDQKRQNMMMNLDYS
jgi:hypothetical protein